MPERETAAMGEELWWRDRAMWLLVRALGGKVSITDEEWARVPERPDLILDHADGVMRWTAKERSDEDEAPGLERGYLSASDRAMIAHITGGGIRNRELLVEFDDEDKPASPLAAELDGQLPLPGTEPG